MFFGNGSYKSMSIEYVLLPFIKLALTFLDAFRMSSVIEVYLQMKAVLSYFVKMTFFGNASAIVVTIQCATNPNAGYDQICYVGICSPILELFSFHFFFFLQYKTF